MENLSKLTRVLVMLLCIFSLPICDMAYAGGGFLSGTVYEVDGTTPIAGAIVTVISNSFRKEGVTDENGNFLLQEMPPELYLIEVKAVWHVSSLKMNISVSDKAITKDIDFILLRSGSVSGFVFSGIDSSPLGGCIIMAFDGDVKGSGIIVSKEDGSFVLPAVIPGNYTISTQLDGFATSYTQNIPVNVGRETPNVNIFINIGGTISGKILEKDGVTPISGAVVHIYDESNLTNIHSATSDSQGDYTFTSVPVGDYVVTCKIEGKSLRRKDRVTILNNVNVTGIDFVYVPNTSSFMGKVTMIDLVTPISEATVVLYSGTFPEDFFETETDVAGMYSFTELPKASDYQIGVYKEGLQPSLKENISLTHDEVRIIDFELSEE